MNWYKLAQKIQQRIQEKGLKPEDLFSFYSMQSLSSETFEENSDILYDFIESINSIREYYLEFLVPRIMRELGHAIDRSDAIESRRQVPDENYYSFENWMENEELTRKEKNKHSTYNEYVRYMTERGLMVSKEIDVEDQAIIAELKQKGKENLNRNDFKKIIELFNNLEWNENYGGPKWAEITKWTEMLYFAPVLTVTTNINLVLSKARYLVYVLDTLHSLHHNNALVLSELPNFESRWLYHVFEIVKHIQSPLMLSVFTNNPKITKALYNERRIFNERMQTKEQIMIDILSNMSEKDRYDFLVYLNHPPLLNIVSKLDADLVKYLIYNFHGKNARQYIDRIFKELVERHGLENLLSSLPGRLYSIYYPRYESAIDEAYGKEK